MELFKIFGSLALNGKEKFKKDIDDTTEKGKAFKESLTKGIATVAKWGAAISAAGVTAVALANKTASVGDNIDKMSQKIGISRQAYQELDFVCSQSGTSVDTLQMGIKTLTNQMQAAADGTKSAVTIFEKLGISIYDSTGQLKSQETMMWEVMSALQGMKNQTEKAAIANDLFGRSGSELMPLLNGAAGSIDNMRQQAQELGLVLNDEFVDNSVKYTDTMDQLKRMFGAVGNEIAGKALPHLQKLADMVVQQAPLITAFADHFDELADSVGIAAVVVASFATGKGILNLINNFQRAQVQLALYTLENEKATIAQGVMNGSFSLGEIAVGLLTGKIKLATVAQAAWNGALSANPIGLVITLVTTLGIVIGKTVKANQKMIDSLAGTATTSEEAAANVESLKAKIQELESTDPAYWSDTTQAELDNLRLALAQAEDQYNSLLESEKAAGDGAGEFAEDVVDANDVAVQSAEEAQAKLQATYQKMFETVGSWFEPFAQAKTTVTTTVDEMMASMQSHIDFNSNYAQSLQTLGEYGLGTLGEYFQSYGADGAAYAQTIVDAVEKAGGATTEAGQEIINGFLEQQAAMTESESVLAEQLTLLEGDFSASYDNVLQTITEGTEQMDKSAEATQAAENTMKSYISALEDAKSKAVSTAQSIATAVTNALRAAVGTVNIPVSWYQVGNKPPGFAKGLDYVPYDEFPALLHKGEAVLTAEEAAVWRKGDNSNFANNDNKRTYTRQNGNSGMPTNLVINLTAEIDGATVARKLYKYNLLEARNHGATLINA